MAPGNEILPVSRPPAIVRPEDLAAALLLTTEPTDRALTGWHEAEASTLANDVRATAGPWPRDAPAGELHAAP
jgi:hypothetical protein